jgi:hypothetical protein
MITVLSLSGRRPEITLNLVHDHFVLIPFLFIYIFLFILLPLYALNRLCSVFSVAN